MTPEQSAAVARLREALLWHNPEASESEFFWRETISNVADPDTIRTLLAALDESQADAARWRNFGAPIAPEHAEALQRLSDEAVMQFLQDQEDAARYRWLRDADWDGLSHEAVYEALDNSPHAGEALDAAIDAARAGEKQ